MKTKRSTQRYQKLSRSELELISASLTPRVMSYAIRDGRVDTWRIRYFMKIAMRGARIGADPKDIEKAMLDWVKSPSPASLEKAEVELVVTGMGYDESAKESGLSPEKLEDMHATLAHFGEKAEGLMNDPNTYREIKAHGAKRGMDNVYKKGIRHAVGLPENALNGRDATELLDKVGEVQASGMDKFIDRADFWDDLERVEQGRLTRDKMLERWQGNGPPAPAQPPPPPPPPPLTPKPKKKKTRRRIELDQIVVNGKVRTIDYDEPVVWHDDEKTRPMIIIRHYTDGTTDIVIGDGDGGVMLCHEDWWAMSRGNNVQPVIMQRREGCYWVPSTGGNKRVPGRVSGE